MEESRAKQIVNELRDELFGSEIQAGKEAKETFEELADLNPNTEIDCREFGQHVRNGGWRLGLLVARNVYEDHGSLTDDTPWEDEGISRATWYRHQDETNVSRETNVSKKISARAFARQAGNISHASVTRFLNAWNAAAVQGFVPHSSKLMPGQEVSFEAGNDE